MEKSRNQAGIRTAGPAGPVGAIGLPGPGPCGGAADVLRAADVPEAVGRVPVDRGALPAGWSPDGVTRARRVPPAASGAREVGARDTALWGASRLRGARPWTARDGCRAGAGPGPDRVRNPACEPRSRPLRGTGPGTGRSRAARGTAPAAPGYAQGAPGYVQGACGHAKGARGIAPGAPCTCAAAVVSRS
ncbi:hypothetical protein GCM10010512_19920 [Streptomyces thermoviolaceus subsp. thermoviolaceus]|nr:hypothetical protein GCM10010512_19920 [Streptomyces thermoviolaceus subsp. thermoviolaceus]